MNIINLKFKKIKKSIFSHLVDLKSKNELLDESKIIKWFKQLLEAVNLLHANKILHQKLNTYEINKSLLD